MITLKDKSNNRWLGQISYAQLKFLNDELVAEHENDQDYRLNRTTLNLLRSRGADAHLTAIIEKPWAIKMKLSFTG